MPKFPQDKKARGGEFEYRSGLKGFVWEGIATKVDPGGSPPNRPRDMRNLRLQGGSIITRPDFLGPGTVVPGQPNFNTGTYTGANRPKMWDQTYDQFAAHWTHELNSVGGTRLWWGATPALWWDDPPGQWVALASGGEFGFFDTDMDPVMNKVGVYQSNDNWAPVIERFNNEVYFGDYSSLRKIYQLAAPPGLFDGPVDILSTPSDEIILSFPGFRPTSMLEYNGKLYMMLSDPFTLGNAEIWSWDGFIGVRELVIPNAAPTGSAMAEYKDTLVVTVNDWGSFVYLDAGGWNTVTPGGLYDSSPFANSMAVYRDNLYIMDGIDSVWVWNGTTCTLGYTITATDAEMGRPGSGIAALVINAFCCVNMNDRLYFGWTDAAVDPSLVCLGMLDLDNGVTYQWLPTFVKDSWIESIVGSGGAMTAMAVHQGRIWTAIGSYPDEGSNIYSHYIQHAPSAGWWQLNIDLGPLITNTIGNTPIYYLRSI